MSLITHLEGHAESVESEEFDSKPGDMVYCNGDGFDRHDASDSGDDKSTNCRDEDVYGLRNDIGTGETCPSFSCTSVARADEDAKPVRKQKALYYEDIVL
ncbi:hypothetical protein VCV18_012639 [Metarhizium anisopliae]